MPSSTRELVGTKNHRITIQQATEARNAIGEQVQSWPGTTIATVWAERRELAGGEGIVADQLYATRAVVFTIWRRTDVQAKQRVVEGSRTFDIQAVTDRDGRKWEQDLLCVESGV